MAYRWNGVECDTYEELVKLQTGSSAVGGTPKRWDGAVFQSGADSKPACQNDRCDLREGHPGPHGTRSLLDGGDR